MYSLVNLYTVYKIISTLSVTQGHFKRSFNKLKIIKNRFRSSLNQEHLEAFTIMSIERDTLDDLDFNGIFRIYKKIITFDE